jgi:hypothetical protein
MSPKFPIDEHDLFSSGDPGDQNDFPSSATVDDPNQADLFASPPPPVGPTETINASIRP